MTDKTLMQAQHEIAHGQAPAEGDTERIWGWGTLAGQLRAKRRAQMTRKGVDHHISRTHYQE